MICKVLQTTRDRCFTRCLIRYKLLVEYVFIGTTIRSQEGAVLHRSDTTALIYASHLQGYDK